MKHTREHNEAKLLAEAQSVIEEFLNWEEQADKPNLTQSEEIVLRLRERLGQRMAEVAIDDQEAKQPPEAPACPTCGAPMRYKGQKGTEVASRIGDIDLERGHYYCARCQSGLFPLDHQLELVDGHWSCGIAQDAIWISGLVSSYEAAQVVLARLSRINLATTSVWRQTQVWGAKFGAVLEAERQRANALPEQWDPPSRAAQTDQRMGVAFDGVMLNILQERWKELKVGVVFDVDVRPTVDTRTKEGVDFGYSFRAARRISS